MDTAAAFGFVDIFKLLEFDYELRRPENRESMEKDLFKVGRYGSVAPAVWDNSLPTFSGVEEKTTRWRCGIGMRDFDFVCGLLGDNCVIAGGSASSLLLMKEKKVEKTRRDIFLHSKDVDIFFYGLSIEKAMEKMTGILENIKKYLGEEVYLTRHSVTVKFRKNSELTIQFVLRTYSSISEIIHGFDLGSCAVAVDEGHFYLTSLSMFSLRASANIVDTTRRSTTYERRLVKYLDRGFDIIMPCMRNIKGSSEFVFLGPKRLDYKMLIIEVKNNLCGVVMEEKKRGEDEEDEEDYSAEYWPLCSLGVCNMRKIKRRFDAEGADFTYNLDREVSSVINIDNFLEGEREFEILFQMYIPGTLEKVRKRFFLDSAKDLWKAFDEGSLDKLVDKYREYSEKKVGKTTDIYSRWITENPCAQLTSSCNPIIENPELWYEENYIDRLEVIRGAQKRYKEKFWSPDGKGYNITKSHFEQLAI